MYAHQDLPLEQLGDIKADSIASWVTTDNVRRTIVREFRNFLVTYVDDQGVSVYGQRIKTLGERTSQLTSEPRVARDFVPASRRQQGDSRVLFGELACEYSANF